MKVCILLSSIFALFILFALFEHVAADNLIFVQVLWRHGNRAPYETFPNDENQEDKWPQGWAQLTTIGMQQQYELGAHLRTKYDGFISSTYKAGEVYIRSTDVDRTLMSAMSNMAGFYPTGNVGINYPDQNAESRWPTQWTPVPIHSVGDSYEICARADQLYDQVMQSDLYMNISLENQHFFDCLSRDAGYNVTLDSIWIIKEALFNEKTHNMTMPSWFTETLYEKVVAVNNIAEDFLFGIGPNNAHVSETEEMTKIRGGSTLQAIVDNMKLKLFCIENPSDSTCQSFRTLKYYAYSTHDVTIGALLSTFGSFQQVVGGGLPQYAATVAVELWNTSSGPQVKIFYYPGAHNQTFHLITNLTQGCPQSDYCPFSTFLKRSEPFFPKDIVADCLEKSPIATTLNSTPSSISTSTDTNCTNCLPNDFNRTLHTKSFMFQLLVQLTSNHQNISSTL